MNQEQWLWERSDDDSARFVLGTVGSNPLICFGVNPSTAVPGRLDRTVARVSNFASTNGYDGWTMLNVYPQIATDPNDLDQVHSPELKAENELHIAKFLQVAGTRGRPRALLAAWGGLIESRAYLPLLLQDILRLTTDAGFEWVSLGQPTKNGHPRHPLYVRGDAPLQAFSAVRYVRDSV